jgi:cysteine desulfurase
MPTIYLDHNATTPLVPAAWDAMRPLMAEAFGNPSSAHAVGRKARQALEDARERIAELLGAFPDEVTFTSGATEANNLAVFGLLEGAGPADRPPRVIASHLEHSCVVEPLQQLARRGVAVEWWPVDSRGILVPQPLTTVPHLVCVMLANHETGAVQPVSAIAQSLPPGVALHCDAAQAVGKMPVNFHELGATTLTASAHKFGGPKGIGLLLTRRGTPLQPLLYGGHQQQGRRPGTEAVALAVGLAVALDHAVRHQADHHARLVQLRQRLWERLQAVAAPVVLNGPAIGSADVVPTTLNVSFPGCRAEVLLMALDLAGVACSTGSACSSGSLLPSPVLRAMGVPAAVLHSALRFSFGPSTELADIDEAADRIGNAVRQLRTRGGGAGVGTGTG